MSFFEPLDHGADVIAAFPGGIAEGAQLRTPSGGRRVEFIRSGDMVVTRCCGLQPVRLVWQRRLSAADIHAMPALAPIRLKPRVIGPMMPQSDVVLAPDHKILIPGWRLSDWPDNRQALVPAREMAGLADGAYIDRSGVKAVFYHFVFDAPQVLTVNGLPVESLVPSAAVIATLALAERESLLNRFPQLRKDPSVYPPAEYPSASGVAFLGPAF